MVTEMVLKMVGNIPCHFYVAEEYRRIRICISFLYALCLCLYLSP